MMMQSSNNSSVKTYNRSRILQAIVSNHASRQDIADAIGLTPAAVSILVSDMIKEGILVETGEVIETASRGRKKTTIAISEEFQYIIGIAIEQDGITISLATLQKTILDTTLYRYYKPDFAFIEQYITKQIDRLLTSFNLSIDKILGVGVSIVGLVESNTGTSTHAFDLWDDTVPLKSRLEKLLHIPVVVDNNVRALAFAEKEHRNNHDNLVFIKYGPGIGASLILDEIIYYGATYKALEFGHTIVKQDGPRCSCGKAGCLETVASYRSIRHQIEQVFQDTSLYDTTINHSFYNIKLTDIAKAYKENDPTVKDIIDRAINYVAIGIINLIEVLDSSLIVIYGSFFEEVIFFDALQDTIQSLGCNCSNMIQRSQLSHNASIGAISIARQQLFLQTGATIKENINE